VLLELNGIGVEPGLHWLVPELLGLWSVSVPLPLSFWFDQT